MQNFFTIGSSPWDEPCAQVGQPGYHQHARAECQRLIELIRRTLGPEPEGARLAVRSFPHDFGEYLEVVCYFETDSPDSVAYAQRCEDDCPATWEG